MMETKLLQAHLEAVQCSEEVSHLAGAHVAEAEDLAREVFLPTGQHHMVVLTQRVQECFGINAFWYTDRRHGIGRIDRISEQVQPYRSHVPAHILAQVLVTHKNRDRKSTRLNSSHPSIS